MSSKVYLHKPNAPDELLGRVEPDGKVYATLLGPDRYIGRVNLQDGKVYEARTGPDRYIGRIDLEDGRVFLAKFGPDEYQGEVKANGRMLYHLPLARDPYLGRIVDMESLATGGAAYLLLILPALDEEPADSGRSKTEPE